MPLTKWYMAVFESVARIPILRAALRDLRFKPRPGPVHGLSQIEIEHVYPRNASSPDANMEPLKQYLENLSFGGPNDDSKAANQSFAAKKKLYSVSKVRLNEKLANPSQFKQHVARKTPRLVEELKSAPWKRSPRTDADEQCEFW